MNFSETPREYNNELNPSQEALLKMLEEEVRGYKLTPEELRSAYEILIGMTEHGPNLRGEVEKISEKMSALVEKGLTRNSLQNMIEAYDMFENSVMTCFSLIEMMKFTDREKEVLKSIVDKERGGELTLVHTNEKGNEESIYYVFHKDATPTPDSKKHIASELFTFLLPYKDKDVSILFSE